MNKLIVVFCMACVISVASGQSANGIWIIDYIKFKPGKEKEALYFYEQNWLVFREAAKKEGFIKSFELVHIKNQDPRLFNLMLMTEFADSSSFKAMEKNFQKVMSRARPNGPLFLNDLRPKQFMELVSSAEAVAILPKQLKSKAAFAQPTLSFMQNLEGTWSASGKAFNMPAEISMSWVTTLNEKFYHLTYRMVMTGQDSSTQTFEGTAYYQAKTDTELVATWFDSGGEMHPIKATVDGESLTAIWGTSDTKLGKTIYRFIDDNTIEITDFIQNKKGEWRQFNRNEVKRN